MTAPFPRRITHHAPPGSLLKRFDVPAPRPHTIDTERDAAYLADVRQCPCLSCGMEPSEAAHVRFASAAYGKSSGLGKKPADRWTLPLCAQCHRLGSHAQHKRQEPQFWNALGINPHLACVRLHAQRGDLVAMRAVVMVTIAERSTKIDQATPPPCLAVPNTAASPASPPRRALPPRPSIKPQDGGDLS